MINYTEARDLVSEWGMGAVPSRKQNIRKHYNKHKQELMAEDIWQYLRKASAFRQQVRGRGSPVAGSTLGVRRHRKQGRYIDLAPGREIISFGSIA